MGSFAGHVLPGSYFVFFGLWDFLKWTYRNLAKPQQPTSRARLSVKCNTIIYNIDLMEGLLAVSLSAFGIVAEQLFNNGPQFHMLNTENQFQAANNWSHCTMYMFFIFYGMANIAVGINPSYFTKALQYATLGLALVVEGYLFYNHTNGRSGLDTRIHMLLVVAIWTGSIFCILLLLKDRSLHQAFVGDGETAHTGNGMEYVPLTDKDIFENETSVMANSTMVEGVRIKKEKESSSVTNHDVAAYNQTIEVMTELNREMVNTENMKARKNDVVVFLCQLSLAATLMLQGSWFWEVAIILYPPNGQAWDTESHVNIQFATFIFAWHLIAILFVECVGYLAMKKAIFTRSIKIQQVI